VDPQGAISYTMRILSQGREARFVISSEQKGIMEIRIETCMQINYLVVMLVNIIQKYPQEDSKCLARQNVKTALRKKDQAEENTVCRTAHA